MVFEIPVYLFLDCPIFDSAWTRGPYSLLAHSQKVPQTER